ncbi:transcription elongation factor GreA [Treponema sp. R6D11]
MGKQITITKQGREELQQELDNLVSVKMHEIAEQIKEARSFGDLSENAEYDEAKNEQAATQARIIEIEKILKNAVVISDGTSNVVSIGSKVTFYDKNADKEIVYQIVGTHEANPFAGKISEESPIGKALIGAKKGAKIVVELPTGSNTLTVIKIQK